MTEIDAGQRIILLSRVRPPYGGRAASHTTVHIV